MTPVWTNTVAWIWFNVMRTTAKEVHSIWYTATLRDGTRVTCGENVWAILEMYRARWA